VSDIELHETGAGDDVSGQHDSNVVLVDEDDRVIGVAGKLDAHRSGALHRAVSVFAFDESGALLVQRRAAGKYHSGGLWSNSACTHPRIGEHPVEAARRCMREELGVECERLVPAFVFTYHASVGADLIEHELDHVFTASLDGPVSPDPREVAEWRMVAPDDLAREVAANPGDFTVWLPLALEKLQNRGRADGRTGG
jgi:isopentenyl-diphosphate Delta-isomerase